MASFLVPFAVALLLVACCRATEQQEATYIVHVSKAAMPAEFAAHEDWYSASLRAVSTAGEILYSYGTVMHGFSARLSAAEARALAARPEVLMVTEELRYELHTTRTPEFFGLDKNEGLFPMSDRESDVVVGVLDTGVWPERRSFDDAGFGPVPAGWRGACETGKDFNVSSCNRKLIGARFFAKGYEASKGTIDEAKESRSPRDNDGHGTHTSSTAAGSAVTDASLLGYADGTARGMAIRSRVAVYKCCWIGGCFSSDILAAIDAAVADGCNVLSLSLGGGSADYYRDSIAIGAFGAMEKGVFVSCSAGNAGPASASLSNVAPWITTVGAGTIDRDFPAYVTLGNGKNFSGVSLYSGKPLPESPLQVIYAANATNSSIGNLCLPGTLLPEKVAGKIVLCDRGSNARVQKGYVCRESGAAGMVLANTAANGEELVADAHMLPAAGIGQKAGDMVRSYILSDPNATVTIMFGGTKVGVQPSPVVAAFSSRGPNSVTLEILKPDLIAPGVNVLAGWTGAVGPTGLTVDDRRVEFNILSGTSMSCPHVSGIAALLRGVHPDWSPAAIRSALMTTAFSSYSTGSGILDVATGLPATPLSLGAGHVDPIKAVDPGLVYDLTTDDYLDFLCALNYTVIQIAAVARRANYSCDTSGGKSYSVSTFNYPSISVVLRSGNKTAKHTRTLTNVGTPGTYKAEISLTDGLVTAVVEPTELTFSKAGERKTYTVSFTATRQQPPAWSAAYGKLVWTDGSHVVASPIAVTWPDMFDE